MSKFFLSKKARRATQRASTKLPAKFAASNQAPLSVEAILEQLLTARPSLTSEAPRTNRGIYGLVDHTGVLRYIGSTSAPNETLYKRIHQRHRTGSEGSSHYFSRMYNTGRMWRDPNDASTKADGDIAKALRNTFIAQHCRAVWVELSDDLDIASLEQEVLAIAPAQSIAWNQRGMEIYEEPEKLVDTTIAAMAFGPQKIEAIARQKERYSGQALGAMSVPATEAWPAQPDLPPLPEGEFRFAALDVETANNDRSNICQIGVAFVRHDKTIETWTSYINPLTDDWSCSRIHGITGKTVARAPHFAEALKLLDTLINGLIVYQHSNFDRSAILAACTEARLTAPEWIWRDSVQVARAAWPELKGNGGHGLASLKSHLGLKFRHHDAGEDAKASAQVVLLAEARQRPASSICSQRAAADDDALFEPFDDNEAIVALIDLEKKLPGLHSNREDMLAPAVGAVSVPYAADGTCFNPGLVRRGFFTIGPKGGETKQASFEDALALLRGMDPPRWRRPNAVGNWGIVSGRNWRELR